jgi:hypothetical protein
VPQHEMEFRVSQAEVFRRWLEDADAELGWVLNELTRDEPNEAMLRGTAFHRALELASDGLFDEVVSNGYTFLIDCDISLSLPKTREIRLRKNYGGIFISGQVDGVVGNLVIDHKTTAHFDAERYFSGFQWRFYLDIFRANTFRWNVFEIKEEDYMTYRVTALHVLEQYRYPDMEQDCRELAHKLRDFAQVHIVPALVGHMGETA